jgi:hypothetical protein
MYCETRIELCSCPFEIRERKRNRRFVLLTLVNAIQIYYSSASCNQLWLPVAYGNVMSEVKALGC